MKKNIIFRIIHKLYDDMDMGKLKRKIATFVGVIVVIAFFTQVLEISDIKSGIIMGFFTALLLYVPIRIRECFGLSWQATIIVLLAYAGLIGTIPFETGLDWLIVPLVFLPIIDIGLSIFVVITKD